MTGHHETPVRIRFRVAAAVATASTVSPLASSARCASRAVAPVVSTSSQTTTRACGVRVGQTSQSPARAGHRARQVGRPRRRIEPGLVVDPDAQPEQAHGAYVVSRSPQPGGGPAGDRPGRVVAARADGGRPRRHGSQHDRQAADAGVVDGRADGPGQQVRQRPPQPVHGALLVAEDQGAGHVGVLGGRPRSDQTCPASGWATPATRARRRVVAQAGQTSRPGRSQPTQREPSSRSTAASVRRSSRSRRTRRSQQVARPRSTGSGRPVDGPQPA